MSEPFCAECGEHVAPDSDHVHIRAETKLMKAANDLDHYYLHPACWRAVSKGWTQTA